MKQHRLSTDAELNEFYDRMSQTLAELRAMRRALAPLLEELESPTASQDDWYHQQVRANLR